MTPNTVVAWFGPVNLAQVGPDAVIPGLKAVNLTCTGDGNPSCGAIADGFEDGSGRRLPNLLLSKGIDPGADMIIGAFSAGGSVAKRLALNADDREQIKAMMLADATYTTGGVDEGFVQYALDVLQRTDKMMVATASSAPNKDYPTGIETMAIIRAEVERRAGRAFQAATLPDVSPAPARVWRLGNVIFAEFPNVPHAQHATLLAGQVWQSVLVPWLEAVPALPGQEPVPEPLPSSSLWKGLAVLAGAALGYVLARGVQRNRRFQERYRA